MNKEGRRAQVWANRTKKRKALLRKHKYQNKLLKELYMKTNYDYIALLSAVAAVLTSLSPIVHDIRQLVMLLLK